MRTAVESRERSFQFRECLGRGGFGEVYRATMLSPGGLKNEVAVKILRDATPDAVRRLRDEGKLLAMLRHPAILRVHDLAGVDGKVALVTEYVEGEDLAPLVVAGAPTRLPMRSVVEVVGAVAEALHAAYSTVPIDGKEPLRLVHRDIKPSNVRVGRHGEVKLLDFGIAWSQDADREARTNANSTVGSLAYMAPERFARSPIRTSADIYSLGCTLYEGIVGARLVPDAVPVEMYQRAASREAHDAYVTERLGELPADLPAVLRELLTGMLAFGPDDRPSPREVAALCERVADEAPGARLRAWCRERDWPEDPGSRGALTGHTLTEQSILTNADEGLDAPLVAQATLDISLHTSDSVTVEDRTHGSTAVVPLPEAEPIRGRSTWIGLTLFAVALLGLAAGAWWGVLAEERAPVAPVSGAPAPVARPTIVKEPAARPALEPAVSAPAVEAPAAEAPAAEAPSPAEDPAAAVAQRPEPAVVGRPEPAVEAPAPEPESAAAVVVAAPEPAPPEPPPPLPPGTVRLVGAAKVTLRSASGQTFPIGQVPAGTYDVLADFGGGPNSQGRVDVVSGATATIECNQLRYQCKVGY